MRSAIPRLAILWLALVFMLSSACECPGPPKCPDPPNCDLAECQDDEACTQTGQAEDCKTPGDEDGDGLVDEADPACVDAVSPSDGTACIGQDTTTTARNDTDSLLDPSDCDDVIGSDSGDGDTSQVTITEVGGVVDVEIEFTESGGAGPHPTATATIVTETQYELGGDYSIYSAWDLSDDPVAEVTTTCESQGYTIDVSGRDWVVTSPGGGSYTCTTIIVASGDGSPTRRFHFVIGTGLAADADEDGVSNFNDLYCRNSMGPVDASGCAGSGTYPPDIDWYCNKVPPAGVCFSNYPAPFLCDDCFLVVDDVEIDASGEGQASVRSDGEVDCTECLLSEISGDYALGGTGGAEVFREASGAIGVDQLGGDYSLEIGTFELFGDAGELDQVVVDPAAFASGDPLVATIEAATTNEDDDLVAAFDLLADVRSYVREIATFNGFGASHLWFVNSSSANVSPRVKWRPTPGWQLADVSCPHTGETVELVESATCRFTLERQDTGSLIPLTQTGIEVANKVAANFGDLGFGELFSVSGANGVGVYRADNFSLVPSLSSIGGFNLINVLGALHLNAPGFPNDGRFSYLTPSGSLTTQYFPEIPGFGASLFGFAAVRDATYVADDPSLGLGVFTTASSVQRLSFEDFGASYPFLTSGPLINAAPAGFSITSAFQATAAGRVLFAARNVTAGANGRLFLGGAGVSSVTVGDLEVDPRLLRCASAVPGTWICVAPNFESGSAHVVTWDGGTNAAVVGSIATGPNPLVPALSPVSGKIYAAIPSFTGDSAVLVRLDPTTGAELGRVEISLAPGCQPSSALFVQEATGIVVTCYGLDALQRELGLSLNF